MAIRKDFPQYYPETRQQWRDWLAENHLSADGVWLVYYKKGAGKPTVTYDEAVEEALCYGWIDSVPNKLDDERFKQLFSPRNIKSPWSKLNKKRVAFLLEDGRMTETGLAKIDAAKENGSWTIYDPVEALEIPNDLQQALANNPTAAKYFTAFAPTYKKGILWWIISAKRLETRQKRVAKTVAMAAQNLKANFDG
ncbi:YdeI/OmpD-associated family protein [Tunicatimonas pelagia]|uniref:YdeI/OmpD-associated family protein n=1 Tax=Tunicatimonas pelagia TaxID=931531 RepID=UPI0026657C7E|nr:YdeI/OmpD-associated family protein [Tunicatimonas pelagia]WKN41551.1 YdeI/OmpD-associated family protein [Tunicatimonas pelagia]